MLSLDAHVPTTLQTVGHLGASLPLPPPHTPLLSSSSAAPSGRSLSRARVATPPAFVRHGSGRGHAEFGPDVVAKFYRMSAEATACGLFFALWWRYSHVQEKNRYDRYYASIKADADDDE